MWVLQCFTRGYSVHFDGYTQIETENGFGKLWDGPALTHLDAHQARQPADEPKFATFASVCHQSLAIQPEMLWIARSLVLSSAPCMPSHALPVVGDLDLF